MPSRNESNWTEADNQIVLDNDNETAARLLDRSPAAVKTQRTRLKKKEHTMNTKKIEASHDEVVIINHFLDAERIAFDAYRVGWSEGTARPVDKRQPIAIRIGRSAKDGTFFLGDYNPDRYEFVEHDEDFRVVRHAPVATEA